MHQLQERGLVTALTGDAGGEPGAAPPSAPGHDAPEGRVPGSVRARRRRLGTAGAVAAAVVACDQVTKSIAEHDLASGPVHLIGPAELRLEYNSGAAFGIARGLTGALVVVVVAVVVVLVVSVARSTPSKPAAVALGLVLGGALGNLADRLVRGNHGAVIDFIDLRYWPTFNVADACITIGILLFVGTVLFARQR